MLKKGREDGWMYRKGRMEGYEGEKVREEIKHVREWTMKKTGRRTER